METTMTAFQQEVLRYLAGRTVRILGRWVWPADVREDARLAETIYWEIV